MNSIDQPKLARQKTLIHANHLRDLACTLRTKSSASSLRALRLSIAWGFALLGLTLASSAFSQNAPTQVSAKALTTKEKAATDKAAPSRSPTSTFPQLQTSLTSLALAAVRAKLLDEDRRAVVKIEITAEGVPSSVVIVRSSGFPELDALILQHLSKAVFSPATENGVAVASRGDLPIHLKSPSSKAPHNNDPDYSPELVTYAPYPTQLLSYPNYFTVVMRIELDIESNGLMRPVIGQSPRIFKNDDDPQLSDGCAIPGGSANLINTWLPYSGIFVHGAKLLGITDAAGEPIELKTLTNLKDLDTPQRMTWSGASDLTKEFGYLPCVGTRIVSSGVRSDDYLPLQAQWQIQPKQGPAITLRLADDILLYPFVLVRYEEGRITPAPMRLVMAGIDWPARKVWLQFMSTLPSNPKVRKVETRALEPAMTTKEKRLNALLMTELEACEIPRKPIEECALPTHLSRWVFAAVKRNTPATTTPK